MTYFPAGRVSIEADAVPGDTRETPPWNRT